MPGNIDLVRQQVQQILTSEFSSVSVDDDGDYSISRGTTRVFVRVWTREEVDVCWVNVFAPVLFDVEDSPRLHEYLALHSDDYIFGHLRLDRNGEKPSLWLSHTLLGDFLDSPELCHAVAGVAGSADSLDDLLKAEFGGHRFYEDDDLDGASADGPTEQSAKPERTNTADEVKTGSARSTFRPAGPLVQAVEPRGDLAGREKELDQSLFVLAEEPLGRRIPLLVGLPGSGRTALLGGIADRMAQAFPDGNLRVWRTDVAGLALTVADTLRQVVAEWKPPDLLCIDDLELLASLGTSRPNEPFLFHLRAAALAGRVPMLLVCDKRYLPRLDAVVPDLIERSAIIEIAELAPPALEAAVGQIAGDLTERLGCEFDESALRVASATPLIKDWRRHPGLAEDRLVQAATLARSAGDQRVTEVHIGRDPSIAPTGIRYASAELADKLSDRVRGQQAAAAAVARRLALTRARLDLRPERPDGVFLFVGPTGVGKTEMARALAEALYGDDTRVIRLDMSEYVHDWAVSRLVGPMPGYAGSTEPSSWLTTRICQEPESVLLLDEIEKAHPVVWNIFLQVFDAGRLTDSRGAVADFSNTVVVMTSNLGVAEASAPTIGFGPEPAGDHAFIEEKVVAAVQKTLSPELMNRLDEIIVFQPLSPDVIREIAATELDDACRRLAIAGWHVDYESDVIEFLARCGYDPAYGARHLQRSLEKEFLVVVASAPSKVITVKVEDGQLIATAKRSKKGP